MSVILATAGYDHKIRFWEAPSGICSRTIRHPDAQVNRLEITPDKQFLAAGGNPQIRLYEINSAASAVVIPSTATTTTTAAGGAGGGTGGTGPTSSTTSTAAAHAHAAAAASNHNPVLTLEGHSSCVTSLGFQREGGFLYSGSEDGTVKLWDLRSPTYSRSFDSRGPVNSVSLHPNQAEIISGDQNGSVKVWDLGTSRCINELSPDAHFGTGSTVAGSGVGVGVGVGGAYSAVIDGNDDDGGGGGDGSAMRFPSHFNRLSTTPTKMTTKIPPPPPPSSSSSSSSGHHARVAIQAVGISEDGQTAIAANNHGEVFVWDPSDNQNYKPIAKFRAHPPGTYLLSAKISPDCRHLVTTGSDRTARLWDTSTWELSSTLAQHKKWVWDAVFSADSSYLVTASSDHSARLWNLRTGEVVRQYTGHQTAVTCVALNDSST